MLNKNNLKIANFCSTSQVKPELTGIFVEPNQTSATDSFILIQVSTPKIDIADFPTLPSGQKPKSNFQPFILPANKAQEIEKNIPVKQSLLILENAVVIGQKKGVVEIATTDLEEAKIAQIHAIEGKYPEVKEILAEKGKYIEIILNPAFLAKIANYFKNFSKNPNITMKVPFSPYGEKNTPPIKFEAENDGQTAIALLMPCQK